MIMGNGTYGRKAVDLNMYLSKSEVQQLAAGEMVKFTFLCMDQPLDVRVSIRQRPDVREREPFKAKEPA